MLSDCVVFPDVFDHMVDRLRDFMGPYRQCLETEGGKRNVHLYLAGLLSHLDRKNAEEIAALVDVERLVMQEFIGTAPWDHRPLVTVLVGQVVKRLGEPDGVITFDPSSFPKRGTHSVGVKRQWCGHRGKVDNCQVGVYMGYVSRHDHALLDFRLSLPEDWARDPQRRQECHVPQAVQYQSRHNQCLEMLDAWSEQVPHGWVTGDDELGRHTRFRHALRERGERYVLGMPCNTMIRDLEAPSPAYQGRGRRPKAPWQSVTDWRKSLNPKAWSRHSAPPTRHLSNFWVSTTISSTKEETMRHSYRPDIPSQPQPYRTQVLDPLGLVAGMFEELGITEVIDQATQQNPEMRLVTVGHAVKAMVLNGLGFVNQPLYLVPHFFHNKPLPRLIAPGIQASHLNDDTLGRALDTLYETGLTDTLQPHCRHGGQALGPCTDLHPSR